MNIIAIDPGNKQSAMVMFACDIVAEARISNNDELLRRIKHLRDTGWPNTPLVIEMIASYGMAVGAEVFETCVWIGRFMQAWQPSPVHLIYRREVKMHLCGQPRAKDPNIRQALIDRYGGKDAAIGTKRNPGPLYGFKADMWAALAVGVTFLDLHEKNLPDGMGDSPMLVGTLGEEPDVDL